MWGFHEVGRGAQGASRVAPVFRGDGSTLRLRRMNRGWFEPSMVASNSLSVIGLDVDIRINHIVNMT